MDGGVESTTACFVIRHFVIYSGGFLLLMFVTSFNLHNL